MAEVNMNIAPQAIECETCERKGWDDGSWSKWTEPAPGNSTHHVCQRCLSSPRSCWKDFFSLCQKSGVGTVHLPYSEQSSAPELKELCIASYQQPEEISEEEQYQKHQDLFEHSPLGHDQIRLLSLLPGRGDLLCTIEHADLNSAAAQYEALSYCWGSIEQPRRIIWINGYPTEVLWNLYGALTQLRKPTIKRKLWIDAVCINQVGDKGIAEKNTQIPLMSRIFHQAASVIVWLGAAEHGSNEILDVIAQQNVDAMQTRKFAMEFGRLLKRSWFRRTWIVQEFVLPYGKFIATHWLLPMLMDRVPDMTIAQLRKVVDSNGNLVSSRLVKRKLPTVWKNHEEGDKMLAALTNLHKAILDDEGRLCPRPLYKTLPFMKDFNASDFKDKIYGAFGLVSLSVYQSLQVDYQKSVAEVYLDAMTYMLREENDETGAIDLYLEFPLFLSLDLPIPSLPSWVPDFSQNRPFLRIYEDFTWYRLHHQNSTIDGHTPRLRKQHRRYTVTRDKINKQLLSVDDTRLNVRGFLIDEVDVVLEFKFFGYDEDNQNLRDYSERQMKSLSEASQNEGHQIKRWLDIYDKTKDEIIIEITFQADDPFIFFASTLEQ